MINLYAQPMYNYPNSLNLLQNFIYVPLCFLYILPVSYYGLFNNAIPHEVTTMSKRPFIIMGFLDCITCLLMTFAAVYLPGSLLILLPQAAIPISMLLSNRLKGEQYKIYQYLGAFVVILGIGVVLEPLLTQMHVNDYTCQAIDEEEFCALCSAEMDEDGCLSHRTIGNGMTFQSSFVAQSQEDTKADADGSICRWIPTASAGNSAIESSSTLLLWSIVTILACIPMTLSSIYKEMILSSPSNSTDIDPIFLNGWVAFYQFLFSFPLAFPAGMTSNPPVPPSELPSNIYDGIKCYLGDDTITTGCHADECHLAPLYVNLFLVFNVGFNILIVYILKFGSANVLFMAGTVMVPVGNIVFALPFMPGSMPLHDSDVAGLIVIITGLVTYRFGSSFSITGWMDRLRAIPPCPWRRGKNRYRKHPSLVLNEKTFEWDAPYVGGEDCGKIPSPEVMKSLLTQPLD
jgi:drug/metabolite transporter (DMT)-like permease